IEHGADGVNFRRAIAMIELEHDGVGLAAVNAWMRCEEGHDPRPIRLALFMSRSSGPGAVTVAVLLVVELSVGRATCPTTRAPSATLLVLDRKFANRPLESAARASLRVDGDHELQRESVIGWELSREPRAFGGYSSADFTPTELQRGPSEVAVGAAHIALGDLFKYEPPRLAHRELGDISLLHRRV